MPLVRRAVVTGPVAQGAGRAGSVAPSPRPVEAGPPAKAWRREVRLSDPATVASLVIVIYVAFLAGAALARAWPVDAAGHPVLVDYLGMWAAGRLALSGHAAAAYDWGAHKAVEVAAVGRDFEGYFSWFYPPPFFFATAPFAALPFVPALLAWIGAGLAGFLLAIRLIVPERGALALAAAAPVVLWNAGAGQNGALSATIIAAALALLARRALVAGALVACLVYKPQFGLLMPVALACGGQWRAFLAAAVAAVVLAAASAAVFGLDAWTGFIGSLDIAYRSILVENSIGAAKLQSVFGLVRLAGGGLDAAWAAQLATAIPVTVAVGGLWWSSAPADLKAAALAAGTVLVTPYVLVYDLVILVVAVAFLARSGLSPGERAAAVTAALLLLAGPLASVPAGLAASIVVAAMVARRSFRFARRASAGLPAA